MIRSFDEKTSGKQRQSPLSIRRHLLAGQPWLDPMGTLALWSPAPVLNIPEPGVQIP